MGIDLTIPSATATFEVRGAVMRVIGVSGGPLEVRVDEGLVFARYLGQEPRIWSDVSLTSVMDLFAADSPISTFLRKQGALPLRQVLLASLTSSLDATNDQA
ncbi:hypothetical protein [Gemmatimonas sp.]|uniref:hypothetical protein n=1 Tax=Gemmatimonas sp. TaxID=1962908 RepID=UPI00286B12C0|nr:hypothetical protein [Gemmatimonas sp.]